MSGFILQPDLRCQIPAVVNALADIAERIGNGQPPPFGIVGIGGNLTLRIGHGQDIALVVVGEDLETIGKPIRWRTTAILSGKRWKWGGVDHERNDEIGRPAVIFDNGLVHGFQKFQMIVGFHSSTRPTLLQPDLRCFEVESTTCYFSLFE